MTNADVRTTHLKDETDLFTDVESGFLPAFSIVKPGGLLDGHPASSTLDLFEGFTKKIVDAIQANPELWQDTAIFVTFDEGGGYWGFRVRPAARLLRRRHAHSAAHGFAVRDGRPRVTPLRRPRLDPEVRGA